MSLTSVAESGAAPTPASGSPIDRLFHAMCQLGASDLHLCVGTPALTDEYLRRLLEPIMPDANLREFAETHDSDFVYEIPGLARFRANVFADRKRRGAVFRVIPSEILTAEKLGLYPHILNLCKLNKGLVLVTGPTGSGKSTTLCAMIDYINRTRDEHIITIEDPIELVHQNQKCLINQREVRTHTGSFKAALRAALREDPDIILVGELRDLETVAIAIETAETGHLVFGTLHTTTACSTVDRIIDQFPSDRQSQIRIMLSESLRGVIAQNLCRKIGGGRVAALEVLIATGAVSNLIREGKTFQIPSMMQVGKAVGMVGLNDALMELVTKKLVAPDEATRRRSTRTGSRGC
ncbi:MAG: type IV pilus twitching motility protein PilT [Acidobacteria bacterium]|nr:type IV pilus twitching motility protein PilT [Acidobacteriota bacterium]